MTELAAAMLHAAEQAYAERPTFNPRIAAAQGVLESGDPPSQLAMTYANCMGIKAGVSWSGPTVNLTTGEETPAGQPYKTDAAFRVYTSWAHCFTDYAEIIGRLPWYADATANKADPVAYLLGLITPGEPSYATDSRYVEKVLRVAYDTGLLPERAPAAPDRLGEFNAFVDNSPSWSKAIGQVTGVLTGKPVVMGPHIASQTRRGDGHKLDVRSVNVRRLE